MIDYQLAFPLFIHFERVWTVPDSGLGIIIFVLASRYNYIKRILKALIITKPVATSGYTVGYVWT